MLSVEAESLTRTAGDAPAEVQGDCCGVQWSGGAQLWLRPTAAGQSASFGLDIPVDGTYSLAAALTSAPDYGIVTLAIDGTTIGTPYDGYSASGVAVSGLLDYGSMPLTAGRHTLTATVTGKDPAAAGLLAGIDLLRLTLAGR